MELKEISEISRISKLERNSRILKKESFGNEDP
jgi:hypothetical protein